MKYTSIMTDDYENCFVCGQMASEWHHVRHGPDKMLSERYGLMVPLCRRCHAKVHHEGGELDRVLKQEGDRAFVRNKLGRCYV